MTRLLANARTCGDPTGFLQLWHCAPGDSAAHPVAELAAPTLVGPAVRVPDR